MYSFGFISRVLILVMGLLLPSSSRISNANAFQPLPTSTSTPVFSSSTRKLSSSSKLFVSGSYEMEQYDDSSSKTSASSKKSERGSHSHSHSHRRNDKRYPNNTNLKKHSSLRMNQLEDARVFQTLQHQNQRQRRMQSSLQAKPNGRSSSRGEDTATATVRSNRNKRRRKSPTARIQLLRPVRIIDHRRHDEYGEPSRDSSNGGTAMAMGSSSARGQGGGVGGITNNHYHQRYGESYINNNNSRTPTRLQISSGLTFLDELGDQLLVSTQKPLGIVLEERGGVEGEGEGGTSGDGGGAPAGPASKMISENQNLNMNMNSISNNQNNNNNNNMGCIVSQVVKGGNADRAGVQVGDYLVAVQNVDVEMASFEEVMDRIASAPKVVNLRFWRRNDDE